MNVHVVDNVNKHLSDATLATIETQDEVLTSRKREIYVLKQYNSCIRALLRKNHQLGNMHTNTHCIDLIHGARPLKSAHYYDGPKARELKELEIKNNE